MYWNKYFEVGFLLCLDEKSILLGVWQTLLHARSLTLMLAKVAGQSASGAKPVTFLQQDVFVLFPVVPSGPASFFSPLFSSLDNVGGDNDPLDVAAIAGFFDRVDGTGPIVKAFTRLRRDLGLIFFHATGSRDALLPEKGDVRGLILHRLEVSKNDVNFLREFGSSALGEYYFL